MNPNNINFAELESMVDSSAPDVPVPGVLPTKDIGHKPDRPAEKTKRWRLKSLMSKYLKLNIICEVCGKSRSMHTHHIEHFASGGRDCFDNYLAVCLSCHYNLHPELSVNIRKKWLGNGGVV